MNAEPSSTLKSIQPHILYESSNDIVKNNLIFSAIKEPNGEYRVKIENKNGYGSLLNVAIYAVDLDLFKISEW